MGPLYDAEEREVDIYKKLFEYPEIPKTLIGPNITVGELGELAVVAKKLEIMSKTLQPPLAVTLHDLPPNGLPSMAFEQRLASIQRKAEHVAGSDLGDGGLTSLTLYADFVEVDKRTFEFIRQLRRKEPLLANLMGEYFKEPDYSKIPGIIRNAL